ncbi:hypothetical protein HPB50_023962 [Hyalomma asiaticum]|uniref:Uncharacterized protein n=1 Tax=Hyalomma asiaticum TaxID=266040 RepID=A0ACB7S667_HYAAI|nr:hypothetical protein HPB50_023962 [Hyalomma asiaticum]
MAPGTTTLKPIFWKFPEAETSIVVIGDSQMKYVHEQFNPSCQGTPVFISQPGARIADIQSILDFVPPSAKTVVLHVGTNDMASLKATEAFHQYRNLLDQVAVALLQVTRIYATLILPRSINRRRGARNHMFIRRCNSEACRFNRLLQGFCRRSRNVFYVDHGFEWLLPFRVLAADGLHPSFEGVALIAARIRQLCIKRTKVTFSSWRDFASSEAPRYPTRTANISASPTAPTNASLDTPVVCAPQSKCVNTECATQTSPSLGRRYPSRRNADRDMASK